jgi:hypothetical protein
MRKSILLLILMIAYGVLAAQDIELTVGPGYELYGFHAEQGSVEVDMPYRIGGIDFGADYYFTESWLLRGGLFIGYPLASTVIVNDEAYSGELSGYDQYRYYFSFNMAPVYRKELGEITLSGGPFLSLNNLILSAEDGDPDYLLLYTVGVGLQGRVEYAFKDFSLFSDIGGTFNFAEVLVEHDDFSYAYSGNLTLGVLWRFQ